MSLLPAKYNLSCWEGATFRQTITVLAGAPGSSPRDFTGYAGQMAIRTAPDTTPIYTLTTTNGKMTLGGAQGTVSLYIPAADTVTFDTWEVGVYELTVTASGGTGDTDALLWGQFRALGVA